MPESIADTSSEAASVFDDETIGNAGFASALSSMPSEDANCHADLEAENRESLAAEAACAQPTAEKDDIADELNVEEAWEEELEERMSPGGAEIRGWHDLREQVKTKLKRGKTTLTVTQVNQLLLIRNFATLRLKGYGRIAASEEIARQWHENASATYFARRVRALARHYQVFEHLPLERRGGVGNAHSLLHDPNVTIPECNEEESSQSDALHLRRL